jgi:hypothetical protein
MLYKKINLELIVPADEADAVIVELNDALDRMEERFTLFGGGTETVSIEHSGTAESPRFRIPLRQVKRRSQPSRLLRTAYPRRCIWSFDRPVPEPLTIAKGVLV